MVPFHTLLSKEQMFYLEILIYPILLLNISSSFDV